MIDKARAQPSPVAPEDAAKLLAGRRTINRFQPEPPPLAVMEAGIEVARWAPNHKLTQPWRFSLLGPDSVAAIIDLNCELVAAKSGPEVAEAKRRRWGEMPGWLTVTCVVSEDPLQAREDYAACCCAVQNLMLYLWSHGIGSKWTTGPVTREPRFYEILGLSPDEEELVSLLWYGYPAERPQTRRKPPETIIRRLP